PPTPMTVIFGLISEITGFLISDISSSPWNVVAAPARMEARSGSCNRMRSGAGANQAAAGYVRKKAERRRGCKCAVLCGHDDGPICNDFCIGRQSIVNPRCSNRVGIGSAKVEGVRRRQKQELS
ncbi:MAG: hypothetical protein AAAC47_04870, partial [Pararhizobium sp.]